MVDLFSLPYLPLPEPWDLTSPEKFEYAVEELIDSIDDEAYQRTLSLDQRFGEIVGLLHFVLVALLEDMRN